jgi:hypothetical protein
MAIIIRNHHRHHDVRSKKAYDIWNFDPTGVIAGIPQDNDPNCHNVVHGPLVGDQAIIYGAIDNGVVFDSTLFFPVINIIMTDKNGTVINARSTVMLGFERLLHVIYGTNTMVNYISNF